MFFPPTVTMFLRTSTSTRHYIYRHITPLKDQCHNSKNAHFELCPQEVCLRPYLPSGIASHVYFPKWPREGRSVVLLMRLHRPDHCFSSLPKSCISRVMTVFFQGCDMIGTFLYSVAIQKQSVVQGILGSEIEIF
jgi:hypothetical protein